MELTGLGMIENKIHLLEQRLAAENESNDRIRFGPASSSSPSPQLTAAAAGSGTTTAAAMGAPSPAATMTGPAATPMGSARPTPSLPSLESTPNRPRVMVLPVTYRQPATETETDKKLKKIMKQTGILTINGRPYATDIKDLKHIGDLGNGTSGNVVKMRHLPSDTIIAVKQMRRTGNTEENKRILMDLDVVLKSDCKYIVRCLGCFVRDPDVWICMELMSMCFDKLLKLSKRPVPECILGKVTVATVKALSYLKDVHNVIHRDVKPSNILIDERGTIKLCDFGISGRLVDSKAHTRSAGCAAYMAPERIDPKKPEYDIRADVWSLGITLVELATARSPYEGCYTDFEVLTKVLDSEPPSLPYGEGYTFSQNFRDFVTKCLTKDFQFRPKYPELLEQPFIKEYENSNIEVARWFDAVVENAGIRTHQRTTTITAAATASGIPLPGMASAMAKPTAAMPASIAAAMNAGGMPHQIYPKVATTTTTTTASNGNGNHGHHHAKQHQQQSTQLPQPITNYGERGRERSSGGGNGGMLRTFCGGNGGGGGGGGGSGSSSAASNSPQSPPSQSYQYQRPATDQSMMVATAAASAAIQEELGRDMQNLMYRKSSSPFLGRRFHNGANNGNNGHAKYGAGTCESPTKKESSVFSSIGQTIIRNLTTSPFSQKKHTNPLPSCTNQIDPLWRMPTTQDCTLAFTGSDNLDAAAVAAAGPTANKTTATAYITNSPAFNRKRYQTEAISDLVAAQQQLPATTAGAAVVLVPNNRNNEMNPQRVQGNQSPIVLQRFYHQQNQLREREMERQQHQAQQHHAQQRLQQQQAQFNSAKLSLDLMSPYVSNYLPSASSSSSAGSYGYSHPGGHYDRRGLDSVVGGHSVGGGAPSSLSSQSTSSQSSSSTATQSSIYENNSYSQQQQHQQQQLQQQPKRSPPSPLALRSSALALGVGVGGGAGNGSISGASSLQYQPLPQQFVPLHALRQSNTPPSPPSPIATTATLTMSVEQAPAPPPPLHSLTGSSAGSPTGGGGGLVASKLAKFYGRRPLQATATSAHNGNPAVAAGGGAGYTSRGLEGGYKDDHGWFNSLAGAMKRQFASYVKLQLNSSTAATATASSLGPTTTTTTTAAAAPTATPATAAATTGNSPYYQRNAPAYMSGGIPISAGSDDAGGGALDFSGTPTNGSSYLRRYAASGGGGGAHLFAGLDRRHRSPDPPPRYNRGQSPLLLRKNLLELSGQPPGSPLLNRRYVTASPPLPPPRRGSESVPGSPQHFRTRIHYTPEPQRRIYRTIDQ